MFPDSILFELQSKLKSTYNFWFPINYMMTWQFIYCGVQREQYCVSFWLVTLNSNFHLQERIDQIYEEAKKAKK